MKRCGTCGQDKPLSEFFRRTDTRGVRSDCKVCVAAKRKARRQRDPDRAARELAEYRARRPDLVSQWSRNRDPAKLRANSAAHRARHRERLLEDRRRAYAENIEDERARAREGWRRRRLGRDEMAQEYAPVLMGDPCAYCGGRAEAVDHIDPVARGGGNDWWNLTAACRSCNSSKNADRLLVFMGRAA